MSLFVQHETPLLKWGIWQLTESWEQLADRLPHHRQQAEQFGTPHRRQEWLAVRALIASLCGKEETVAYHPNGKPYLVDNSHSISISHTRGYAAVIMGKPDKEVGIDIEQYGERVHRVAHKFMRTDESVQATVQTEQTDTYSLLLHWSAKETMFKCLHTTDVDFREHLRIFPFVMNDKGSMQAQEYRTPEQQLFTIEYELHTDFVLTYTLSAHLLSR
ncbi:MAG: 4'-phosphopantetheinyl transferase superfamily protein [Prevotellaceae bacterium]|jgi:4'-phosphopantetheinyl transferase EntD|nr:4'-phosphopantetheinyl transferase superfamily protein [Prevotellaceae bacterium]